MKKTGFTLIELLAVIVILAILALIVSPIISKVIKDARISGATRSMEGFVKSINSASMLYSTNNEGTVASSYVDIETLVDVKNKNQIKNSQVKLNDNGMVMYVLAQIDNYYCIYKEKDGARCSEEEIEKKPGTKVYFNPVSGQVCDKEKDYTEANSASGIKEGCMLFYVIKDNGDTVDLILDHNTSSGIQWDSSWLVANGPRTAFSKLKEDTSNWAGVPTRTDSYTVTQGETKYVVNYNESKARLITAQEIADITGATIKNDWDESIVKDNTWFYLDSLSDIRTVGEDKDKKTSDYAWLFNNLSSCQYFGCTMSNAGESGDWGYWTATSIIDKNSNAWLVRGYGYMNSGDVIDTGFGIRPVITVPFSVLD